MEHISKIANSLPLSRSSNQSTSANSAPEPSLRGRLSETLLDNFWLRMGSMFGHTWTSAYGTKPDGVAGDTWAAALGGLTGSHIAEGLRAVLLLASDFPPSAPRFRSLCFGIPTLTIVRRQITEGNSGPFARAVWARLDAYRYRNAEASKADRLLKDAYDETLEYVMRGGELCEEDQKAIEKDQPVEVERTPEEVAEIGRKAQEAIDELKTRFGQDEEGEAA